MNRSRLGVGLWISRRPTMLLNGDHAASVGKVISCRGSSAASHRLPLSCCGWGDFVGEGYTICVSWGPVGGFGLLLLAYPGASTPATHTLMSNLSVRDSRACWKRQNCLGMMWDRYVTMFSFKLQTNYWVLLARRRDQDMGWVSGGTQLWWSLSIGRRCRGLSSFAR